MVALDDVAPILKGIPHMRVPQGRAIYNHVIENGLERILELGCAHGVSACYLGAAVSELGQGHVTTIDFARASTLEPSIFDLLERTGLGEYVTPLLSEFSYTWQLKSLLAQSDSYDFIFIDAGHTWDTTGFGFFLADRLLDEDGWILFDDLNWSFERSPSLRDTEAVQAMPVELRRAKQVSEVFDVLVATDPRYETLRDGNWGWAHKLPTRKRISRIRRTNR